MTPEELREHILLCSPRRGPAGFVHFANTCVQIPTEEGLVPFTLWAGQERIAAILVDRYWVLALKGRQLGVTTIIEVYTLWRLMFSRTYLAIIVSSERLYAEEFVAELRDMYLALPGWCRLGLIRDTTRRLAFGGGGVKTQLISLVGTKKTGRSLTGDLAVFDEASYIDFFGAALAAAHPVMERRKGQMVVLSTSSGPGSDFHRLWVQTYGVRGELLDDNGVGPSRFRPLFIRWDEAPGRDQAWYLEQKRTLDAVSPVRIKQEHPNTVEEAFEFAEGRVFPAFGPRHSGEIQIEDRWNRYRAIDWGETKSAYVVVWVAVLEKGPPGFVVSSACPNTYSEFISYRFDEDTGRPQKGNDHTIDALRYLVTTYEIVGTLYVYRELYVVDSVAKGWTPMKEIRSIHEMSGWERAAPEERECWQPTRDGELFVDTVCDRSLRKMALEYTDHGIPCRPARHITGLVDDKGKRPKDVAYAEVMEGVRWLNNLIDGTEIIDKYLEVTRRAQGLEAAGLRVSVPARETRRRALARRLIRGRRVGPK